ncbi:ATP-binding protein [Bacillus sp. P14.5]|uniref:ATP-binding protein n=1 Tax=Bacillus sp. P14.5 TaxID=1983400 RepID=UPI000DEBD4EB|nr:ATP-binding protein [Bacillus sp. P14.5]
MDFILLMGIAVIPFIVAVSLLVYSRNTLSEALALFLLLICFWQLDISLLYAHSYMQAETLDRLFRLLRIGPIMITPVMYYLSFYLVRKHKELNSFKRVFNKKGLIFIWGFSLVVYIFNFTGLGIREYELISQDFLSPAHLLPIYGPLNSTFIMNIILVFIITLFLLLISFNTKDIYYGRFYKSVVAGGLLLFLNGVISGFGMLPLYFSSLNSILVAVILFIGFYQMQSQKLKDMNFKLAKQSRLLEEVMDINPNYIVVLNKFKTIITINDSMLSLLSASKHELEGRHFSTLLKHPYEMELNSRHLQKLTTPNGDTRFVQWGCKKLKLDTLETFTLFYGIDYSSQKKQEELLIASEKFKVIGELAASIAHEIRNPLTTIRGFIQLLNEKNQLKELEGAVLEEINGIEQVLKELLLLARPEAQNEGKESGIQPIKVLEELKKIKMLFEGITLEQQKEIVLMETPGTQLITYMGSQHFKQIMVTLLKNGLEALPRGGKIKLKLDGHTGRIRIRIIDNGRGIPKERLSRIGEPYYTNREKGSGIGLTICFKLVRDYGGDMKIQSKEKWGTGVTIMLSPGEKADVNIEASDQMRTKILV